MAHERRVCHRDLVRAASRQMVDSHMPDFAQSLGWIATFLFTICYIPQIMKTLKTQTIDGVSLSLFIIMFIANIIALWYAFLIDQRPLQIKYSLALIFVATVIFLYIRIVLNTKSKQ